MIKQFSHYTIIEFDTSQGESFFHLIDTNRDRLEDFFPGTLARTRTLNDTLDYCEEMKQSKKDKSYFPFIIMDQRNGQYAGYIDIKSIDWKIPKAQVGYFIDRAYEGKGLLSEALSHVITYISKKYQFKKLLCRIGTENIGSIRVAQKNGFELEGTIRSDFKTANGTIVDLDYYGLVLD